MPTLRCVSDEDSADTPTTCATRAGPERGPP